MDARAFASPKRNDAKLIERYGRAGGSSLGTTSKETEVQT